MFCKTHYTVRVEWGPSLVGSRQLRHFLVSYSFIRIEHYGICSKIKVFNSVNGKTYTFILKVIDRMVRLNSAKKAGGMFWNFEIKNFGKSKISNIRSEKMKLYSLQQRIRKKHLSTWSLLFKSIIKILQLWWNMPPKKKSTIKTCLCSSSNHI